jgi:hypothetical protein
LKCILRGKLARSGLIPFVRSREREGRFEKQKIEDGSHRPPISIVY